MATSKNDHGRRKGLLVIVLAVITIGLVAAGSYLYLTRSQGAAEAVELADAGISSELAGATVLALGEATHGTAEFQRARLELVRKLPDFRAAVFEEDYGSVVRLNDYVQGGPGSPEDAAKRFGFALNHTAEMAEFLKGIRDHNAGVPARQRIQLIGMDVQRVDANRAIALDWLERHRPEQARDLRSDLSIWTDASNRTDGGSRVREQVRPAVDELAAAITALPDADADWLVARNAASTLQQHLRLKDAAGPGYAAQRAMIMDANLARTVDEQAARGNQHTLVFGHNGHLDKTSAAYPHDDLGTLAARRWGDDYRVIGTELVRGTLSSGDGATRWQVSMTRRTPLRGMFAGTAQGYLEFHSSADDNRRLLARPVRMSSAGERFRQWQAMIPWLSSVRMTPAESYDALIMVADATPAHPL